MHVQLLGLSDHIGSFFLTFVLVVDGNKGGAFVGWGVGVEHSDIKHGPFMFTTPKAIC